MQYFSVIVVGVMTIFAIIGIIDSLFLKDKLGLGTEFRRGIEMIGPLCLAIIGIIALVPVLKWVIEHTLTPLYQSIGLDPSMAVTTMGWHSLWLYDGRYHCIYNSGWTCGRTEKGYRSFF